MNADPRLYRQAPFRQAAGCEFRPGGIRLTEELAAACAPRPGERLLDLGCGVGSTACHLARTFAADVVGFDASPEFLEEARRSGGTVQWVLGRADALPFPDGHFDAVFAECFLSAFGDPTAILREVRRVVRTGGRLATSDMYLRQSSAAPLDHRAAVATCLRGARSREATLAMVRQAGFTVRMWRDRSDALKALMASLIMAYGSAAAFWAAACATPADGAEARSTPARDAPAYATPARGEAARGRSLETTAGGAGSVEQSEAGSAGADPGGSGAATCADPGGVFTGASWAAAVAAARPGYYLLLAEADDD